MNAPARRVPEGGNPLRVLMFGYCFYERAKEPAIGVYKRLLRIGTELVARGHRVDLHIVHLFDDVRFSDPLVELAARTPGFSFVELPIVDIRKSPEAAEWNLRCYADCIAESQPDVVLIGEIPLGGDLLASSLAAAQSGVPVVVVDNTYCPPSVEWMAAQHGPLCDGLLLVGPSSHEMHPAPPGVHYAPPFAPSPSDLPAPVVEGLAADGPCITVLGYDPAVRQLGLELASALSPCGGQVVVISSDPTGTADLAAARGLGTVVLPLPPPSEELLFALLRASRLAIVKGGFMQVTECLSLGTPVVAFRYGGSFSLGLVPESSRRFVVAARDATATADVVAGAGALLVGGRADGVHEGPLPGIGMAADAVERVARTSLRATTADCERLGISAVAVTNALRTWWGGEVAVTGVRATHVKGDGAFHGYAVVVHATMGDERRSVLVLCRVFGSQDEAAAAVAARDGGAPAGPYIEGPLIVERWQDDEGRWLGEQALPWRRQPAEAAG